MFDTLLLKSFRTVAQEASFTKAADRLHLTQSAVSTHIRRLEEQVGKPLFTRTTRSVLLTPEGELFLGYVRAILRLNEEAKVKLSGAAKSGHLAVGASDDFMSHWLPALLSDFQAARQGLTIDVRVANPGVLLAAMDQGELDLVVGSRCRGDRAGQLLWREPLIWAYAKGALPDFLSPLPLAFFPEPCPYRDAALAALALSERDWRVAAVCPSIGSIRATASAGLAVAPLNRSLLTPQLEALDEVAGLPPLPDVEFMVFTRPGGGPPEIDDLAAEIVRAARLF